MGTKVAEKNLTTNLDQWHGFTQEMNKKGIAFKTFQISVDWVKADPKVTAFFGIQENSRLLCLSRLRGDDDGPFVYFESYFHPRVGLTGKEDFTRPLYDLLENDFHIVSSLSKERIKARLASTIIANCLKINSGDPVLVREGYVFIHTHNKYELSFIVDAIGRRFVSGNISRFLPGDLVFMAPEVPHCWEIDNKDINPKAIVVHFTREFFEQYIMNVPEFLFLQQLVKKSTYGLFIKGGDVQAIQGMLTKLLTLKSGFDGLIKILKLLKYIAHLNDYQTLENHDFQWDPSLPQNYRLKKIYEYVFFNFQGEIRLNEVSSLVGITEGAFCAFFKKNTKKNFFRFYQRSENWLCLQTA